MKSLYIKQQLFSLGEKFTVIDESQQDIYFVEGGFLQIPKQFTIYDRKRTEVATITKKVFSLLPKFFVEMEGREIATISKELSFLKPRFSIDSEDIVIDGNWWEMNFQIYKSGQRIGSVSKQWFTFGDAYNVQIEVEHYEALIISIVVAIDCVKSDKNS